MRREKEIAEEILQHIRETAEKVSPVLSLDVETGAIKYVLVPTIANLMARIEDLESKLFVLYADFEKPVLQ